MDLIGALTKIVGSAHVLRGADMDRYATDVTRKYISAPQAVARPGTTHQVSQILRLAHETGTPVVPIAGNTGLTGGTHAEGALMLSVERMNRIAEIRPEAGIAIVEAGVILSALHAACAAHDLVFPLTFGARGSAMVGGFLATNAGGSNVLRYGNARALCLGLEVVLPGGEVMNLMTELHKDNSGYDLRDLFIGSEGTLGIITGAVLNLSPKPAAYATAMVASESLDGALALLNRLQRETGGTVEAFEYMPRDYVEQHLARFPDARPPFERMYDVNLMVEVGALAPREGLPAEDGSIPVVGRLQDTLAELMEEGLVLDAVVAKNEIQRAAMWLRREQAAELALHRLPLINNDVSVPLDKVTAFYAAMDRALPRIDPGAQSHTVAHLGDGNIHYTVWPGSGDVAVHDAIMEKVEDVALSLGGSFSAEHGIGLSKRPSMARRKDKAALQVMRAIKGALDPAGIMNPGKVLPD